MVEIFAELRYFKIWHNTTDSKLIFGSVEQRMLLGGVEVNRVEGLRERRAS